MEPLGDHFVPSALPGLIVGLLYGLSSGGGRNALLGAAGGLVGALANLLLVRPVLGDDGIVPLAIGIGLALLGALALVQASRRLTAGRRGNSAE